MWVINSKDPYFLADIRTSGRRGGRSRPEVGRDSGAPVQPATRAQYVERPVADPTADTLSDVIGWMERNLDQPVTVSQLATPHAYRRAFRPVTSLAGARSPDS